MNLENTSNHEPLESRESAIELERLEYVKKHIDMPHVEPISRLIENRSKEDGGQFDPEVVKDICYAFLENGLKNSKIFTSEKHKVGFPYTTVDTAEVAKMLYEKYSSGEQTSNKESTADSSIDDEDESVEVGKKRKEFLFGSFQLIGHGNQFTFTEEVLHQIMKDLPKAMEKLKRGEEPDSNEVCVLGSPTTFTGTMSPEFLEKVKKDPFGTYGDMYAELVQKQLPQNDEERKNTNVLFYGISMGGSFASETARKLLDNKKVTQSQETSKTDNVPFLRVRIDTPPGPENEPGLRSKIKMVLGFAREMGKEFAIDSYTRAVTFGNGKYMKQVNKMLTDGMLQNQGIVTNMSPEQEKMKTAGIRAVIEGLAKGVPLPPNLKISEVKGLDDLLTYDKEFNEMIDAQREQHVGTLGMHRKTEGNVTSYGADMGHAIPFMRRKNEITRMTRAMRSILALKG